MSNKNKKQHSLGSVAQLKAKEEIIDENKADTPQDTSTPDTPAPIIVTDEMIAARLKTMSFRELNDIQDTLGGIKDKHMVKVNDQRLAWWQEVIKSLTPERRRMVVDWYNLLQKNESKTMSLGKNGVRIPYGDGVHDITFNLQIIVKKAKKIEPTQTTK